MYPYYNMQTYQGSIYTPAIDPKDGDDRFAGGIIAPLLLGGVAGYAIGQNNYNNRPYMFYTSPYYYPPMPYNYYPYNYYRR